MKKTLLVLLFAGLLVIALLTVTTVAFAAYSRTTAAVKVVPDNAVMSVGSFGAMTAVTQSVYSSTWHASSVSSKSAFEGHCHESEAQAVEASPAY